MLAEDATFPPMTLSRWDGVVLDLAGAGAGRLKPVGRWRRLRLGPCCPQCLEDAGGRWQLWWRSGWAFACPDHALLLEDTCPTCHREPRTGMPLQQRTPLPTLCEAHVTAPDARPGHRRGYCGAPLTRAARRPVDADGPVVAAQRQVLALLDRHRTPDGDRASRAATSQDLRDLDLLARRALSALTPQPTYVPPALAAAVSMLPPDWTQDRHVLDGGPDVLAVGLTAAVAVQLERHHGDSPTLQWLVGQTDAPDAGRGRSPYAAYRRLSQASSERQQFPRRCGPRSR